MWRRQEHQHWPTRLPLTFAKLSKRLDLIIIRLAEPSPQVDSFEQRLKAEKAEVGLQKLENSSLAEFAAEIQRDGDQV